MILEQLDIHVQKKTLDTDFIPTTKINSKWFTITNTWKHLKCPSADEWINNSVQFSHSDMSNSLWPHDCSTPGFPIHHQLLELAQTHIHWVGDSIQPTHPLLSPSPPAFNLSQHHCLCQWVSSSHQVTKEMELQLQHQSFQWIFRADFLYDWLVWSPCSPRDSQESPPTPQFKSINSLAFSFPYGPLSNSYMTTGKSIALTRRIFVGKIMSQLFSMLSRMVIAFLPRSKRLLISWLQSPSAMIL